MRTPEDRWNKRCEVIQRTTTDTGEWQLQRRGSHYEVICNGVFLMASYNRGSGRKLAALALERVSGDGLWVMVGGLGVGFTAQAVLEDSRVERLEIVEIEPVVVSWHLAYFADLCGRPLEDPRTTLIEADLHEVPLRKGSYDAILLDTDNGPDWLALDVNRRLYTPSAVSRYLSALAPQGVLAFWSSDPVPRFATMLKSLGASVEAIEVPDEIAPGRQGSVWVYVARRRRPRF